MWKIFDGKEVANGVVFIKSRKDFNTVIDITKRMEDKNINLVVVRTLKEISSEAIDREAFLEIMADNGITIYLFDEGCFATVNYDEC